VLLVLLFPAMDVITDLIYLSISKFYNTALFVLCVLFFMHPAPMFFHKLYRYKAYPYALRYIWWLGYSTTSAQYAEATETSSFLVEAGRSMLSPTAASNGGEDPAGTVSDSAASRAGVNSPVSATPAVAGDHIPFPTFLGDRFSLVVSFESHDNLYVIVLELLTWVIAVFLQIVTLFAFPMFLVFWLCVGIFLQMTKTISMGTVWNVWFYVWTGHHYWDDTYGTVDTEDLNYGLLTQFCMETIPHIILQTVNNTLLGNALYLYLYFYFYLYEFFGAFVLSF
jgi:hypothetical protein